METKPGIYTTEFWITLFTNAVGLLDLAGIWNYVPDRYATILLAVVNAAYAVARGQAKSGVAADPRVAANYRLVPRKSDGVVR